ncbi:hypothetical protein [Novosphingobium aquimarinum]|uniref:hypothetical protein n=1 Tax=Novosphingobium aquimarinum TaxID=2682494 RepID=UPI0012EB538E|nr:hypothetical protein [Novosphingobium aquimarinum]
MRILPVLFSLALAACAPQENASPPAPTTSETVAPAPASGAKRSLQSPFQKAMSPAKRAQCEASGGTVEARGMAGMEACLHTYADGGKACTDSSQCEGKCVGQPGPETQQTAGSCQKDDKLFGCYSEILGGKPAYAICVD